MYQHFGSRLDLVDAICETFDANPALLELRQLVGLPDADEALARTIANTVQFWSSEDAILSQLYGVAAIDPAARDLVDRQRADRRGEMERLVRNLRDAGRLRVAERRALALLLVLTSYETFRELRLAGLSQRQLTNVPFDNTDPAWSPDGKKIAFLSKRNGGDSVYVMNADGSSQKKIA